MVIIIIIIIIIIITTVMISSNLGKFERKFASSLAEEVLFFRLFVALS